MQSGKVTYSVPTCIILLSILMEVFAEILVIEGKHKFMQAVLLNQTASIYIQLNDIENNLIASRN